MRKIMLKRLIVILIIFVMSSLTLAQDVVVPDPANYQWTVIASDFDNPLGLVNAGDGSGRLFVIEQAGLIWIIEDDEVLFDPFLDISALLPPVVFQGGYTERGLLGLAFHPDYESNGLFFINYTDVRGDTIIARYQVSADDPNRADESSATVILKVNQPYDNHNGGDLAFGSDGYLYIGLGDGGSQDDPLGMGQRTSTHLGKMLRIDVNAETYVVPADNPFVNNPDYKPEIWAIGLRNPWRYSFDMATGDLYIADVGQWKWEEINFQPAGVGGQNYGWNAFEGSYDHPEKQFAVDPALVTMPVAEYPHEQGCSVSGGYVYRGEALPELDGIYLYGDYCNGRMWALTRDAAGQWVNTIWMETGRVITAFGQDEAGEIYLVDYKGEVARLVAK